MRVEKCMVFVCGCQQQEETISPSVYKSYKFLEENVEKNVDKIEEIVDKWKTDLGNSP